MNIEFEKLIDKEKFQVFIMYCPAYFPFNFFRHPWIVLNKKGEIYRWEIRHLKNKDNTYLYINNQPQFEGINKTIFIKSKWNAKMLGFVEGEIALNVIDFIEKSKENYPYINRYCGFGPNSNTFIQWILNKFPEFNVKLSWRFIGKGYNKIIQGNPV
jgi:hypothetical protein